MDEDDFISKTRRKRQMKDLQDLGAALVKLSPDQLARVEMPEALREAVLDCKRMTKHEAVRRQVQYIGRVMRDIDAEPIADQIARMEAPTKRHVALFHVAEQWRRDLIDDPAALERFVHEHPDADPDRLRALIEAARKEEANGAKRAVRSFRELFHVVNAIVQEHARRQP
ncbi:MAG TPA: ribosome biogenesis factor YjgA [Usitatibacter sp.]|nr:ribosome biogenesis factor YjgA [Usitatibacter sp.]